MQRRAVPAVAVATSVIGGVASATLAVLDEPATIGTQADRLRSPQPSIGGCEVFPADHPWNTEISR